MLNWARLSTVTRNRHPARLVLGVLDDRVVPDGEMGGVAVATAAGATATVPVEAFSLPADALTLPFIAAAPASGGPPVVRFNAPLTGVRQYSFVPYEASFGGGVRLAVADVTGDLVPDLVTGVGPGGGSRVRVMDGRTGDQVGGALGSFAAFEPEFTGGVSVAAADVNGDGFADVVVAAGVGGGPRVRVYSGADGGVIQDFFAADPDSRRGLSVAAADLNDDGRADVITGAGAGGPADVAAFSGTDLAPLLSFAAFEPEFTGGVSVAARDLNGDGVADIVVGPSLGGGPRVRVLDGRTAGVLQDFFAFDPSFRGGASVAASDVDGDGRPEILVGAGPGGGSQVRVFDATTLGVRNEYAAFSPPFDNYGVVVAGR